MTHPETTADMITRDCLAARVRLLNRRVLRVYDEALRPLGIKVTQLNVLVVLARLGLSNPTEVTQVLDMEKSTVSRNVERLRRCGLVEVRPSARGRTQLVSVTPRGQELLEQALPRWEAAQRHTEQLLGASTTEALRRLPTANWS